MNFKTYISLSKKQKDYFDWHFKGKNGFDGTLVSFFVSFLISVYTLLFVMAIFAKQQGLTNVFLDVLKFLYSLNSISFNIIIGIIFVELFFYGLIIYKEQKWIKSEGIKIIR